MSDCNVFAYRQYFNIPAGFSSMGSVFLAYTPDARCRVPPFDNRSFYSNLTEADILNLTTPYDVGSQEYIRCQRFSYNLSNCVGDLSCVNKTSPAIACDFGFHYNRSLFVETAVTEFDLVCDRKILSTVSTSMYMLGLVLGSIIFGNISDMYGRQRTMVVTFALTLGCMFGVAFSHSVEMYIIFRLGNAMFAYGTTIATFVYIMEITGSEWRSLIGISYQINFALGYMIMSGVAYHWRNWHHIQFVCALLSIPFLLFSIMLPESPRWLFTRERDDEGKKITERIANINGIKLDEEIWKSAKSDDQASEEVSSKKHTIIDLFRPTRMRIITLKVMFNWFVNSFVYYGVSLNAGALAGDLFVNNTLGGVMEIGGYILCILLMDRIGRRILLSCMLFLAGIGLLASVVVNEYAEDDQKLVTLGLVLAFAAKVGISGSFAVIYNFTTELFPTVVRSNAVGAGSMVARIGGVIAPFVIALQDNNHWLPNVVFGVTGVVAGVLSLTFPETNGQCMMETMDQADHFYETGKVENVAEIGRNAVIFTSFKAEDMYRTDKQSACHVNQALEQSDQI